MLASLFPAERKRNGRLQFHSGLFRNEGSAIPCPLGQDFARAPFFWTGPSPRPAGSWQPWSRPAFLFRPPCRARMLPLLQNDLVPTKPLATAGPAAIARPGGGVL